MTGAWVALAVFAGIVSAGALLRGYGLLVRRRALARLPDRATRVQGFTLRIMARGRHGLPGVSSGRTQRTTGDLGYTDDRLLLASNRGVLVDMRADGGRFLTSVRTTGPGKIVVEGETPGASGPVGTFRLELGIAEPAAIVADLQRFVRPPEGRPAFGTTFGA